MRLFRPRLLRALSTTITEELRRRRRLSKPKTAGAPDPPHSPAAQPTLQSLQAEITRLHSLVSVSPSGKKRSQKGKERAGTQPQQPPVSNGGAGAGGTSEPPNPGRTPKAKNPSRRRKSRRSHRPRQDPSPDQSDGKDPLYESWELLVRAQLIKNADHFPTPLDRRMHVFGLTTGDAQAHLLPQMQEGPFQWIDSEDMIRRLRTCYTNPDAKRDARVKYGDMRMGITENYWDFRTSFLHLAGRGGVSVEDQFIDFFLKLTPELRKACASVRNTWHTFTEMNDSILSTFNELESVRKVESRRKDRAAVYAAGATPGATTGASSAKTLPSQRTAGLLTYSRQGTPSGTPATRYATPARSTTLVDKPIRCYNCVNLGHWSKDCSEPRKVRLQEIEEDSDAAAANKEDGEDKGSTDSGNEQP